MKNQSLKDIIDNLPVKLKLDILEATEVPYLVNLKSKHKRNKDIITVIDARIENLTHLAL